MEQQATPTAPVPTYLKARVAAGHAVPVVEVVSPQSQEQQQQEGGQAGASGKRKAADESSDAQGAGSGEEEVAAMLEYVVTGLNEELVTELLGGFHCGK
jgi:hypothetical protein